MSYFAPDAIWEEAELGATFDGERAIRTFLDEWRGRYEEYEMSTEEFLDLANGVVFVVNRETVRLAGSTARLQERWAYTYVVVNGMIASTRASSNIDEARAAAERLAAPRC
jgi:hypothetical protein